MSSKKADEKKDMKQRVQNMMPCFLSRDVVRSEGQWKQQIRSISPNFYNLNKKISSPSFVRVDTDNKIPQPTG
jgi:hypothetical protein